MEGLPPLNLSGGHAQAGNGDMSTQGGTTGSFNFKRDSWADRLPLIAVAGAVAVYLIWGK